jgi:hypothetical protein
MPWDQPSEGLWPSNQLPALREEALRKLAIHVEHTVGEA